MLQDIKWFEGVNYEKTKESQVWNPSGTRKKYSSASENISGGYFILLC